MPKPLPGNVAPRYPAEARDKGVEGTVRFRVDVDAVGAVTAFHALESVDPLLVSAAATAVHQWRFTPATIDGRSAPGVYVGQLDFLLDGDIPAAQLYRASSKEAWRAVHDMLDRARIKADIRDDEHQQMVTDWIAPDRRTVPDAKGIGLPEGWRLQRYKLSIFVSPFVEPARVYVGSIAEAEIVTPGSAVKRERLEPTFYRFYNLDTLRDWVFEQLDGPLGASRPIPISLIKRTRLIQSLLPASSSACDPQKALSAVKEKTAKIEVPTRVYKEQPIYPGRSLKSRQQGTVKIQSTIFEDGATMPAKITRTTNDADELTQAAARAVSLWRYAPARVQGCAVPIITDITVQFSLQ